MTASFILGLYEHNKFCFDRRKLHCHFKGNTTVQSYQPTKQEKQMMDQAVKYSKATAPNALYLNNAAKSMLTKTMGDTKQQYDQLLKGKGGALSQIDQGVTGLTNTITSGNNATATANKTIGNLAPGFTTAADSTNDVLGSLSPRYQNAANATNKQLASLANGYIPKQYQTNMENAIRSGLENTMGSTINSLGQRGVLNSSVTNAAMNDISKNAADTVAQQYQNNINTIGNLNQQQLGNTNAVLGAQGELAQQQLGNTNNALESRLNAAQSQLSNTMNTNQMNAGLYGNLIDSANAKITSTAAAQEAYQQPALNLWNASLGLNSGGTLGALAGVSGKGTTTTTQDSSGGIFGGNGLFGMLGGLASGWASTWCFGADTLVKMADGTAKYIQDIVKGDKVLCPHVDGTESTEEVLEVMEPHHADVYAVTATDEFNDYHVAFATSSQPILCDDGTFVTVGNMKIGKKLRGGLELVSVEYDEFCPVYDLKVSGENNYYADGFVAKGGTNEW